MITIKEVRTLDGQIVDYSIPSSSDASIDAKGHLLLFPGIVDSHICFGPSNEEEWLSAIQKAFGAGITTAIEIPHSNLLCLTKQELEQKRKNVDHQLLQAKIPLNYYFYSNADPKNVDEIGLAKNLIKAIAIVLNPSIESLDKEWEQVFQKAAWENLPIAINSVVESSPHDVVRRETLIEKAIHFAEKQNTRLYILNVSSEREIDLINEARQKGILIYSETTPEHLFTENLTKNKHLWNALKSGIIDTIGSGYAPQHLPKTKLIFKGKNFHFLDPIFLLPRLLTAALNGKIEIEKIARAAGLNISDIFNLGRSLDFLLVDLEKEQSIQEVRDHHSIEIKLKGWPIYSIVQGRIFTTPHAESLNHID